MKDFMMMFVLTPKLKLMVDSKSKKVVFAEAGSDFVDFLFRMLSLPLATVVDLLNSESMTGSLPELYNSVKFLSTNYFKRNVNEDTVLMPKLPIDLPLLLLNTSTSLFKCPVHNYISDREGDPCPDKQCCLKMKAVEFTYCKPTFPGFVKGPVRYMIMDNLEVKPLSMSFIQLLVNDFHALVEHEVYFGIKEARALLKASLETRDVLTTVFSNGGNFSSGINVDGKDRFISI